jgi:hypothetical protein
MTNINLGTTTLSATAYAVRRNVILGTAGSGKTHAGKFIAENLMDAGIPVVVIDPLGNWRGLNTCKDQNATPYNIVVVGKDGDVALDVDTIEEVMRMAMVNRLSVVIDLYDRDNLDNWHEIVSKAMFVLLYENKEYGLRHVIIEESAEFIGQQAKKTESSVVIEKMARMAGNVKVGMTFINQTSEQLSKAVLKLCDGKILGRQTESNTLNTIRKWMGESGVANAREIAEGLPSLKAGQFWVWSTDDTQPTLTKVPDIKTIHPSRNTVTAQDIRHGDNKADVVLAMQKLSQPVERVATNNTGEILSHAYQFTPESDKPQPEFDNKSYMVLATIFFIAIGALGLSFAWWLAGATALAWFFVQK